MLLLSTDLLSTCQHTCLLRGLCSQEYTANAGLGIFDEKTKLCLAYEEAGHDKNRCRAGSDVVPPTLRLYQPSRDVDKFCKMAMVRGWIGGGGHWEQMCDLVPDLVS